MIDINLKKLFFLSQAAARVMDRLRAGDDVALISDAGTPLISDPGFVLVRELRARGRRIVPLPGPCALVAALSASASVSWARGALGLSRLRRTSVAMSRLMSLPVRLAKARSRTSAPSSSRMLLSMFSAM